MIFLCGIIGAIIFIPGTFIYLFYATIKTNDDTQVQSKKAKGVEMMFESFPQFILSLFMMQALQISKPLNILSCSASGLSVIYGTGDFLAMIASDNSADYPFSR